MKIIKTFLPLTFIFIISINAQESTNSIDELNESVGTSTKSLKDSAANQKNINTIDRQTRELEFDYKDKLVRSTIEKIDSDVSTVKEDVNEIKESLAKMDERLYRNVL